MRTAEIRVKAEAEFHDSTYQNGTRKSISRFYDLMEDSSRFYRNFLRVRTAGKQVLEYGCGENSAAPFLANHGAQVIAGIDISDVAIEQAKKAHSHIEGSSAGAIQYFRMNAEELEFNDNSFDLICGIAILHHLDLDKAYREIARVLRPDGSAIFLEPLAHNPLINMYRRLTPHLRTQDEHPLLMRDVALAKSYFGRADVQYYNLFSLLAIAFSGTPAFTPARRVLNQLDKALFACVPFLRRYAWTISLVLRAPHKAETLIPTSLEQAGMQG